jgi:hypothetical protein
MPVLLLLLLLLPPPLLLLLLNSVALSPQANYTERPPLVGEVSANFCGERVPRGQRNRSPAVNSVFLTDYFYYYYYYYY